MPWEPEHNAFTTFVKDSSNNYIKSADGSWVVLTLSSTPIPPESVSGSPVKKKRIKRFTENFGLLGNKYTNHLLNRLGFGHKYVINIAFLLTVGSKSYYDHYFFDSVGKKSKSINDLISVFALLSNTTVNNYNISGNIVENLLTYYKFFGNKYLLDDLSFSVHSIVCLNTNLTSWINGSKSHNNIDKILMVSSFFKFIDNKFEFCGKKSNSNNQLILCVGKKSFVKLFSLLLSIND